MIFLISYDRRTQRLTQPVEAFPPEPQQEARDRRLEVQLGLPPDEGRYEVVLLEAASIDVIKQTHARYFCSQNELVQQALGDVNSSMVRAKEDEARRRIGPVEN